MKKKICILGIITTLVVVMASLGACSKVATPKSQVTTKTSTTTSSTTSKTTATTSATTPTSNGDIFSLAQNIPAVKYTMVESDPGVDLANLPVYLKKDKGMRFEMDRGGISTILLVDSTTGDVITYMPAQNTAYKTSNPGINPFYVATTLGGSLASTNHQANGTETIDGIACQIYEFSDSDRTSKIWFWKDKGLPIKVVATDSSGTHTIEYKNYDFSDIPDSMFVLPAGVTIGQAPTSKTTATTSATTPTSNSDIFSLAQNITAMKYSTVESLPTGKTTGTVYEKKDKMRMEANVNGVSEINFTDFTTQTSYTYTPVQNTAYLTSGVTPSMLVTSKTGLIKSLNPQMIGTETIDGIVCQIYETTNSGDTAKIWFWKDKGLPIKIVMTDSGGTDTIEYKNYDFSDIPDSMFVLPAGVTMVQAPGS